MKQYHHQLPHICHGAGYRPQEKNRNHHISERFAFTITGRMMMKAMMIVFIGKAKGSPNFFLLLYIIILMNYIVF